MEIAKKLNPCVNAWTVPVGDIQRKTVQNASPPLQLSDAANDFLRIRTPAKLVSYLNTAAMDIDAFAKQMRKCLGYSPVPQSAKLYMFGPDEETPVPALGPDSYAAAFCEWCTANPVPAWFALFCGVQGRGVKPTPVLDTYSRDVTNKNCRRSVNMAVRARSFLAITDADRAFRRYFTRPTTVLDVFHVQIPTYDAAQLKTVGEPRAEFNTRGFDKFEELMSAYIYIEAITGSIVRAAGLLVDMVADMPADNGDEDREMTAEETFITLLALHAGDNKLLRHLSDWSAGK